MRGRNDRSDRGHGAGIVVMHGIFLAIAARRIS